MSLTKFSGITDKMLFNFCPHRTSVAKQASNGISSRHSIGIQDLKTLKKL